MLNRDVFQTDPEAYRIANQGVAKTSFPPSPEALDTLRSELETFVCDGHYADGLERILSAYLANAGRGTAPAVWISGFYGSGKSHLASMLAALWTDLTFPDGATAQGVVQHLPASVQAPLKELRNVARRFGGVLAAGDTLGSGSQDPLASTLGIVLRAVGLPTGIRSAQVAFWLADEGILDPVCSTLGAGFDKHIGNFVLSSDFASAVLQAKPTLAPDVAGLRALLQANFSQPPEVTVEFLVKMVRQALLLGRKEIPATLIVLDEVQQYIKQDARLTLQVQTIVEQISNEFQGRVLLVCTGQQALGDMPNLQKLLGRFPVRIALGEADIDAVIRKTVLRKKPGAEQPIKEMLSRCAGEVSRQLHGAKVAHTHQDGDAAVLDWPLLPSRRRVWELILRELDRSGLGGTLRGQLATTLEATRLLARKPLGHAVPTDFLYARFAEDAYIGGLLPSETRNRVEKLRGGSGDEPLKARILMMVYMLGRIQEGADRHGVRARAETIADLLIEDLTTGEPDLRRRVPELLVELRDDGAVLEVAGEWKLQTKESADWDQAYRQAHKDKQSDEVGIAAQRRELLAKALAAALPGTSSIQQGRALVSRTIHHLVPDEKAPVDGVPLRRHNGWESDIADAERRIAAAPATDPNIHLLIDSHRSEELRSALIQAAAARSVLNIKGVPSTDEGGMARKATESREGAALRQAEDIVREAVAKVRVRQAGGTVVTGQLASAIKTAAANALIRLYPQFDEADHAEWGKAFAQAQKKNPDAIKAVDHQGAPETHPVCKAILQFLGGGKKGSEIRGHLEAPPFGWPRDAIDASLMILANAGQLRVTGEDGKAVALADQPRQKIGLCAFRPETTLITTSDKIAVRGLLAKAGVGYENEQEALALSALLERLKAAAKEAGGEAPAPPPPAVPDIAQLQGLSGNDLLKALADRSMDLKAKLDDWSKAKTVIAQRLPPYRLAERLVALGASDQAADLDAVRSGRLLLTEPDPLPSIVQAAADALRTRLKAAWQAWQDAWARASERLGADPAWAKLTPEQKHELRQQNGLLEAREPKVAMPQDIVAALEGRSLDAWSDLAKALAARVDDALADAARLLEPKVKDVEMAGATLKSEGELDTWLAGLRAKLLTALADGPVRPKVR